MKAWFVFPLIILLVLLTGDPAVPHMGTSQLTPDAVDSILQEAAYFTVTGQFSNARIKYEGILRSHYNFLPARFGLARLLAEQGRLDESKAECKKILYLAPENTDALFSLAKIFLSEKNYSQLSDTLKKLFQLDKNHIKGRLLEAESCLQFDQTETAWEIMSTLVTQYQSRAQVMSGFLRLLLLAGEYENALAVVNKLPPAGDEMLELKFVMYGTYFLNNQFAVSKDLEESIFLTVSGNPHSIYTLADLIIETGLFEFGERLVSQCIRQEPTDLYFRVLSCRFAYENNKIDLAIHRLRLALQGSLHNELLKMMLAQSLFEKGDFKPVIELCDSILEGLEDFSQIHLLKARGYWRLENYKKAQQCYITVNPDRKVLKFLVALQEIQRNLPDDHDAVPEIRNLFLAMKNNFYTPAQIDRVLKLLMDRKDLSFLVFAARQDLDAATNMSEKSALELRSLESLRKKDNNGAIQHLEKLIKKDPENRFALSLYRGLVSINSTQKELQSHK